MMLRRAVWLCEEVSGMELRVCILIDGCVEKGFGWCGVKPTEGHPLWANVIRIRDFNTAHSEGSFDD
jgi:hypothetical protein